MTEQPVANQSADDLVRLLDDHDLVGRRAAREQLARMGGAAIPALSAALASGAEGLRWEAARTLSVMAIPSAIPALIEALEDNDPGVRWLAASGLVHIGDASVVPVLHALLGRADSPWFREGAHHVLKSLVTPETSDVVHALEERFPAISVPVLANTALANLNRRK